MPIEQNVLAVIEELEELSLTRKDHWQIPRVEGELLYQLALNGRAKVIVEIGTSYGFSTLFWGAAAQQTGGKVHTIDIDARKVEMSRATFQRAGLGDIIVNYQGDGMDIIPKLTTPIDILFIDAFDKAESARFFDLVWSALRPGASVFVDNTKTHPQELANYVAYVRGKTDGHSIDLPIGNGVEWTLKTR